MAKLKVLVVLFFIPLCTGIFYNNAAGLHESSLKDSIFKSINNSTNLTDQQRTEDAAWIKAADFKAVCQSDNPEYEYLKTKILPDFCSALPKYQFFETAGIFCVGFGAAFMLVLFGLGRLASRSRESLLTFFKVGWVLARPASLLMVLAQGVMAFFLIFDFSAILFNRIFVQILGAIAIAGVVLLYQLTRIFLKPIVPPDLTLDGVSLTSNAAPLLWRNVRHLASKIGTQPPDQIIVGHHPSFFVTEFPVAVSGVQMNGRTLVMSLPILERYSHEEASAVIAHELAHFQGADTKITQHFYPIFRGTSLAIHEMFYAGAIGIPAYHLLNYFMECFAPIEAKFGRERELAADQTSVSVTSKRALAFALFKVHLFGEAWERAEEKVAMEKAVFGMAFVEALSTLPSDEQLKSRLERRTINHPMDTHPPLAARLEILGFKIGDFEAAKILSEPLPADKILDDSVLGTTKDELESEYQSKMALVHEKIKVKTATGDSAEERATLEKLFPVIHLKAGRLGLFMVVLFVGLGALFGVAAFANGTKTDLSLAGIFVLMALGCLWGGYYYLKVDSKRTYTLYYDRIESNQWLKPLRYSDIKEMSAQSINGAHRVIITLNSSEAFPYERVFFLSWVQKKALTISISGLDKKPDYVLNKLYGYYLREPDSQ